MKTDYPLYADQIPVYECLKRTLIQKQSCLIVAPCATGKTRIFSEGIRWLHSHNKKCAVIIDRYTLVDQIASEIEKFTGISPGIACKTMQKKIDFDAPVIVGTRQTMSKYKDWFFNCLFMDEVHLFCQTHGQYLNIYRQCKANYPEIRTAGFTATPYRMDGFIYGHGKIFDKIDYKISNKELLEQGRLSPLRWRIRQSDAIGKLDAVKKSSTGELNTKQHESVLSHYVESVFDTWKESCQDRKTVIFGLNIAHAELIKQAFNGVHVGILHYKLKKDELQKTLDEFISSKNGIIINVDKLTIGSDIPDISAIILARRVMSTSLFFQMVGRGGRIAIGKTDCIIEDLCGNALIHNIDPDHPIINFSGKKNKPAPLKICPMCETPCGNATKFCPECGYEFIINEPESVEISESKPRGKMIDFAGFETIEINKISFSIVIKTGKPPYIRVDYYAGRKKISDWIGPGNDNFMKVKADQLWQQLGGGFPIPRTAKQFLQWQYRLKKPSKIIGNFTGKFPKIKGVII